jgi:hypothetical protein
MKILIALAAALSGAIAPNHLLPEESPFTQLIPGLHQQLPCTDYENSLFPAFGRGVRIFSVQDCSPFPESVVGLKKADNNYYIFGAQPSARTSVIRPPAAAWGPPLRLLGTDGKYHVEQVPERPAKDVQPYVLKFCTAQIDQEIAERLIRVWDGVLLETRPTADKVYPGTDGAIEHFGSNIAGNVITGVAVGTPRESPPGWLGVIAYDLTSLCWQWNTVGPIAPRTELEQAVKHLEDR